MINQTTGTCRSEMGRFTGNDLPVSRICHAFQPIYQLRDWVLLGNELLLRGRSPYQHLKPIQWFDRARCLNRLYELDMASLTRALLTAETDSRSGRRRQLYFINLLPSTLTNRRFFPDLEQVLSGLTLSLRQVCIEISEEENVDMPLLAQSVAQLRRWGMLVSVDDLGQGYGSIYRIMELEPDFVKLDRYFAQGLHLQSKKQRMVRSMLDYCGTDIQLILEGIELKEELCAARQMGVPFGQGYILGRPELP